MMRTLEELKEAYAQTKIDDELVKDPNHERVYVMKNQKIRNQLQDEYDSSLPIDKKLAIYLHKKCCQSDHTAQCPFFYEIKDIEHKWDSYAHRTYLEKARKLLNITHDIELLTKIIEALH